MENVQALGLPGARVEGVHGDDEEFRAEAAASQDCIAQAFEESIPRSTAQAEELSCTPKQHGTVTRPSHAFEPHAKDTRP